MLRLTTVSILSALLVLLVMACGGAVDDRAAAAGGTPAPDGADGYCCPARMGECALRGGYRESGECATNWDICDGMCAQKIEKDEHGCDALTYTPCSSLHPTPVTVDAGTK